MDIPAYIPKAKGGVIPHMTPQIVAEVVGLTTAWDMACAGVGATLLPLQFVRKKACQAVTIFRLTNDIYLRQPAIAVKHGQHLTPYAQYAMELLTQHIEEA